MKEHGLLKVQSREEAYANRALNAASKKLKDSNRRVLGDAAQQEKLVERLMKLHGDGGSESAKRKFAASCAGIVNRSGRVAETKLSEFVEDAQADSNMHQNF